MKFEFNTPNWNWPNLDRQLIIGFIVGLVVGLLAMYFFDHGIKGLSSGGGFRPGTTHSMPWNAR
ncbi:MAG TPA: hypothetical protein VEP90_24245 [Methylomirabilota bacterium]|nr:hypothetical protein [Methylomirabilota bacterium]